MCLLTFLRKKKYDILYVLFFNLMNKNFARKKTVQISQVSEIIHKLCQRVNIFYVNAQNSHRRYVFIGRLLDYL